ncbi:MAG: hypothetical protein QHJ73_17745, partial [Armatimonadota bacterium]|nr:hypothetical protein [Armatimonadota bacterium]
MTHVRGELKGGRPRGIVRPGLRVAGRGHHHQDNLNIEMFARGLSMAPELGYPCWAHPMGSTSHVAHHNTGMIDRSPQYSGAIAHGTLELFAGAPEASFADVSAAPAGFPHRVYRRAVCLADAPGGNAYLVDILRLAGGKVRTCCFHGPAHDGFQSNLPFAPAGEALEVGPIGRGLSNNIVGVESATFDGDAWGDWKCLDGPARFRLTYLGEPGRRYLAANCAKPDIPPVRFFFAEEEKPDGASQFLSLWQPYEGRPFIEKAELLPVDGAPAGEYPPVALRVTLAGGQVDTFLYSWTPQALLRAGDLQFRGSFGYWSEKDGRLRALHLVNGERLCRGRDGVSGVAPAFVARVRTANLATNTLTLDAPLPAELRAPGQLLFLRNGPRRAAYHLAQTRAGGREVRLDLNGILFRSKLLGTSDDGRQLVTEISPPLEASGGFPAGYYNGAVVTGEDLVPRGRVARVEGNRIHLDGTMSTGDFPDLDGDGRRMVCLYDVGPGDEVVAYRSVFLRAAGPDG